MSSVVWWALLWFRSWFWLIPIRFIPSIDISLSCNNVLVCTPFHFLPIWSQKEMPSRRRYLFCLLGEVKVFQLQLLLVRSTRKCSTSAWRSRNALFYFILFYFLFSTQSTWQSMNLALTQKKIFSTTYHTVAHKKAASWRLWESMGITSINLSNKEEQFSS
jgi:hypothetical protein